MKPTKKKRGPRPAAIPKIGCVQHDCPSCKTREKREREVVVRLQNAEGLLRGATAPVTGIVLQNINEALGLLNAGPVCAPKKQPSDGPEA